MSGDHNQYQKPELKPGEWVDLHGNTKPLYTTPPKIFCGCGDQIMPDDGAECGTCVTARNAVKQEPLAQMKEMLEVQGHDGTWNCDTYSQGMYNGMEFMVALAEGREPVFREPPERWLHTPPQREWKGLTDDEIEDCLEMSIQGTCRAIEAKLKEKNT